MGVLSDNPPEKNVDFFKAVCPCGMQGGFVSDWFGKSCFEMVVCDMFKGIADHLLVRNVSHAPIKVSKKRGYDRS